MIKYLAWILAVGPLFTAIQAQPALQPYPEAEGHIVYRYEGNTEGTREIFFRDFGKEQVMFTKLIRSSTFYAITTTTPENTVEFLQDGVHYHFDLDQRHGQVLKVPYGLLEKYLPLPEGFDSTRDALEAKGAEWLGNEDFKELSCDRWQYRDREFLLWGEMLMQMEMAGFNKDFNMQLVEMNFGPVPPEKFDFPKGIPVK